MSEQKKGTRRKYVKDNGVLAEVSEPKISLTVRLSKEAMAVVLSEAAKHGVNRTAVVEMILRTYGRERGKLKK